MILAHFSDLHLQHRRNSQRTSLFSRMLLHAISAGAEHILITGDLSDDADPADWQGVRDALRERGVLDWRKASVVPGNHDLWGHLDSGGEMEGNLWDRARRLPEIVRHVSNRDIYIRNRARFMETLAELFDGDTHYPVRKVIDGRMTLLLLNSVDDHPTACAVGGRIVGGQLTRARDWLEDQTPRHTVVLAMHHHLWDLEAASGLSPTVQGDVVSALIRKLGCRVFGFSSDEKERLRPLLRRTNLILHGHIHDASPSQYLWNGITVLNGGALDRGYALYRITDAGELANVRRSGI